MANGFCKGLLRQITEIGISDPSKKVEQLGFLQMLFCCMDNSINLSGLTTRGHKKEMDIWYRERLLDSQVLDADPGCDNSVTLPRKEFTIPGFLNSSISIYASLDEIRNYCEDASNNTTFGRTQIMQDIYDRVITGMFAVLANVDKKLVTAMSTKFGTNLTTGDADAKSLVYDPADSFRQIIRTLLLDQQDNEFCDNVCIVGNGDITALELDRDTAAAAGVNLQALYAKVPQIFRDKWTRTAWGENQFGVFEKGTLALINYLKYEGSFDTNLANSKMFTAALPVDRMVCPQNCLDAFKFDIRIREIDCPTTIIKDGVEEEVNMGYQIVISKDFNLFVKPGTLYNTDDPLYGVNGTLRYELVEPETGGGGDDTNPGD